MNAQIIGSDLLKALGDYLGYGAIGLGLGVAILSAILLLSRKQDSLATGSRYMMFGLALVVIGSALEMLKLHQANAASERAFIASQHLPDEFWGDFLLSRQQKLFGTSEPTDEYADGSLKDGEEKIFNILVPQDECRFFFAAVRPPAKIYASVAKGNVTYRSLRDKEYYKTGKICNLKGNDSQNAELKLHLSEGGQYSISAFKAAPDISVKQPAQQAPPLPPSMPSSPPLPKITKRFCTGEYEANCAGPHDAFFSCGNFGSDQEVAAQLCQGAPAKAVRINTKGGNKCGYTLTEVTCG